MNIEDFLLEILELNSESGNEKRLGELLGDRLQKSFKIEKQIVDEERGNFNLFAYVGNPKIILEAHLDTVRGQLKVEKEGNYIYGRGACDTKGQIAAMILAAEKAVEEGVNNFGLLFTVQEETNFAGAIKAVGLIPESCELIIIGEPSDFYIIKGHNGLVDIKLTSKGKSAHGATPEEGINAIEIMMKNLEKIKKIDFGIDENLGRSPINIGMISGGSAPNIVPDEASTRIVVRNSIDSNVVLEKIRKEVRNSEIEIINTAEPVFNEDAEKIANKLNLKTKVVPYFTEAYFFNKKAKTIIFGAPDSKDAHTSNEKIKIEDLNKLIEIYYNMLKL